MHAHNDTMHNDNNTSNTDTSDQRHTLYHIIACNQTTNRYSQQ